MGYRHGGRNRRTRRSISFFPGAGTHAEHLEGRGLVRPGVDRGQALLRDRGEGHPLPPGAPRRRRAHPLQAHLLGRRRGGHLRRHRQGLRPRRRRDGDPRRRGLRRPAPVHSRAIEVLQFVPAEQVDPVLLGKPYYLRARPAPRQALRAAARRARRCRPGRHRQGRAAAAGAPRDAAGPRRRARAATHAVARRGPRRRSSASWTRT